MSDSAGPGRIRSWWDTRTPVVANPHLDASIGCDALVIGGGVAGLHAALRLARDGARVVLLEKAFCGGSTSGKSSGLLTPDSELELHALIHRFGPVDAERLWRIAEAGVDLIVRTAREHHIECDLEAQDSLFVGIGRGGERQVAAEAEARRQLGYAFEQYSRATLSSVHTGRYRAGVRYGGTWVIDPLAYCRGLKRVVEALGAQVYEGSEVLALEGPGATTRYGRVRASRVIVCVDNLPRHLNARAWPKYYHAQTFLAISEPMSAADLRAVFPDGPLQVWDSGLVYSYHRVTGDKRLLLGGGSPVTTFAPNESTSPRVINSVIRRFRKRCPAAAGLRFEHYWPGMIDITRDLLPLADRDPDNPYTHYVVGAAGLPWAAWCGESVASSEYGKADRKRFFAWNRPVPVGDSIQRILGKPLSFTLDYFLSRS